MSCLILPSGPTASGYSDQSGMFTSKVSDPRPYWIHKRSPGQAAPFERLTQSGRQTHDYPVYIVSSKCLVVVALVILTGGHWVLLQSLAWVGMTVSYAQSNSFEVALKKTFDGHHPCCLCKFVRNGRASEHKQDLQTLQVKFDFDRIAETAGLFPPRPVRHFILRAERANARAAVPPLPPPRAA